VGILLFSVFSALAQRKKFYAFFDSDIPLFLEKSRIW